jgi:aspartyl-tRNA(Asn)/glutamyl-tRNA(Gln) amidotransferase subunit A
MPAQTSHTRPTVMQLAAELEAGRTSSAALVEEALACIADPQGEGRRCFIGVYADRARKAAAAQDALRKAGYVASPLSGLPVSIKDLFDVAGERTLAGSRALDDAPPAARDAPVVARLRAAGAVLIGRTNMTEFAFSGVGINPHFGTPGNPHDRSRIPGGSSSGAAVSVADGFATVAIGSDTGGSVRIPAALCGVVGFKPTQRRVSREGAIPLSTTLDSVGPLANSVACCALTDAVLAGEAPLLPPEVPLDAFRLGVPRTLVLEDLDAPTAGAFERAATLLSRAGARLVDLPMRAFSDYPAINAKGGFSPSEALAWHAGLIARRGGDYDPRVRQRIERGGKMTAVDYVTLSWQRRDFIARVEASMAAVDALLMPTTPLVAPPIAAFEKDEDFWRLNSRLLRNTAIVNFLDGCAVSLPIHSPGDAPVGLMIAAGNGNDRRLLGIARGIEAAIERSRRG